MESIFLFFTFLMLFSHILSLLSLYLPRNLAQRTEPHILSLLSLCLSSPYPLSLSWHRWDSCRRNSDGPQCLPAGSAVAGEYESTAAARTGSKARREEIYSNKKIKARQIQRRKRWQQIQRRKRWQRQGLAGVSARRKEEKRWQQIQRRKRWQGQGLPSVSARRKVEKRRQQIQRRKRTGKEEKRWQGQGLAGVGARQCAGARRSGRCSPKWPVRSACVPSLFVLSLRVLRKK